MTKETTMRRAAHRGAYEQLWSEQKFAVLAISSKRFMSGCRRLNQKAPKLLGFLDQLSGLPSASQGEPSNAFLTVYGMIRHRLDRRRRRELVELLVTDPRAARDELFQDIVRYRERGLYGCRLLYPPEAAFKYWDLQEQDGLWILLGPWFLHLGYPAVRKRLESAAGIGAAELDDRLRALVTGIDRGEYETWPAALRLALQRHNMVALPGYKAFLHPRVAEHLPLPDGIVQEEDPETASLLALERYWDAHPEDMPLLPETHEWVALGREAALDRTFSGTVDLEAQIESLREEFRKQAATEGRPLDRRDNEPDEDAADAGFEEDAAGYGDDTDDPLETLE